MKPTRPTEVSAESLNMLDERGKALLGQLASPERPPEKSQSEPLALSRVTSFGGHSTGALIQPFLDIKSKSYLSTLRTVRDDCVC